MTINVKGAERSKASNLSSIPPCPGSKVPESLMPAFLLALLSTRSESVARIPINKPKKIPKVPINKYATNAENKLPIKAPSQLFFGEIIGDNPLEINFLPKAIPPKYAN